MKKYGKAAIIFFVVMGISGFVASFVNELANSEKYLTSSELEKVIHDGNIKQIQHVVVTNGESNIHLNLNGQKCRVHVSKETKEQLVDELNKSGVSIAVKEPDKSSYWRRLAVTFFTPIAFLIAFFIYFRFFRRK